MPLPRPIPESYWVRPGQFLAGEYPGHYEKHRARQRISAFLEAGFTTFIDLTGPDELTPYESILRELAQAHELEAEYTRISIQDRGLPSHETMERILNTIDNALAKDRKVYLHCWGGVGRTATVVGCYLVRHGMTGEQALRQITDWWMDVPKHIFHPNSPETHAQVEFIYNWREGPHPRGTPGGRGGKGEGKVNWHQRYLQQASWTRDLRDYLFEKAGLENAQRVLEVGCGTGAILTDLTTPASLHGLDLNPAALAECRFNAPDVSLTQGEALTLPFPDESFDIVYCHFLLLWVIDPLQAVSELKRVTRREGSILALAEPDYSARIDKPDELAQVGQWQTESLRRQGADPAFGGHLAGTFHQAGIKLMETGPIQGQEKMRSVEERNQEWEVIEADLAGFVPGEEIHKMKLLDEEAWKHGNRILHVPTFFAQGKT